MITSSSLLKELITSFKSDLLSDFPKPDNIFSILSLSFIIASVPTLSRFSKTRYPVQYLSEIPLMIT